MRRIGVVGIVTGALLLLAGCADQPKTVDHDLLVTNIGKWATKNGVPGAHVQCPDDVPIKAESTFHCIVRKGGQSIRLTVTIENDKGYLTWVAG